VHLFLIYIVQIAYITFSETDEWFDDYANFASLFKTDVNVNGVFSAGYINGLNLYLGWVKG